MGKKIYEASGNIYLASLKCTLRKGARIEVEDGMMSGAGNTVPVDAEFSILLRHGMFLELTSEEAQTPEKIEKPKEAKPRPQLKMQIQEDSGYQVEFNKKPEIRPPQQPNSAKHLKSSQDLQVIEQPGLEIQGSGVASLNKTASSQKKKEMSPEELQEVENRRKERLAQFKSVVNYETPNEINEAEMGDAESPKIEEKPAEKPANEKRLAALEKAREAKRLKAEQAKKAE